MKKRRLLIQSIWWIYLLLLFSVVILKFRGSFAEWSDRIASTPFGTNYNLIPFKSIGEQLAHFSEGWARFNFFGNIVPFVPFGFLLPLTCGRADSFGKVCLYGAAFVLFIETLQFFTRLGSFDVDDICLNMLGIIVGFVACEKRKEKTVGSITKQP